MDLVTIKFECTREAADTLLPLLIKARILSYQSQSKWCAFFVDGEGNFRIGDITAEDEAGPVEADVNAVWSASAVMNYDMDGKKYEHIEEQVFLSDAGE